MKRRLYSTKAWQALRADQLAKEPLCRMCAQVGVVKAARIVDHVRPHRGNERLFYDASNLQSLCKYCHDSHKQRQEKSGYLRGCDESGHPTDPNHHWNREGRGKSSERLDP